MTAADLPDVLDDRWAVRGVLSDDQDCLGLLYDRHAPAVFGLCVSRTASRRKAEDALFFTFVDAWRYRARITMTDGTVRSWLMDLALDVVDDRRMSHRSR